MPFLPAKRPNHAGSWLFQKVIHLRGDIQDLLFPGARRRAESEARQIGGHSRWARAPWAIFVRAWHGAALVIQPMKSVGSVERGIRGRYDVNWSVLSELQHLERFGAGIGIESNRHDSPFGSPKPPPKREPGRVEVVVVEVCVSEALASQGRKEANVTATIAIPCRFGRNVSISHTVQ